MSTARPPGPPLSFEPAARLSPNELTRLWNQAYEDYVVPIAFTEAQLQRHVRRARVDLALSLVARREGEPIGLSLAACQGALAYIAGFGVAKPMRRGGVASALIAAQLAHLAAQGLQAAQLEVIETNPAREVYARAGFRDTRRLLVLEGRPLPSQATTETLSLDPVVAADAHARLHRAPPTWRRQWPALQQALQEDGARALGCAHGGRIDAVAVTLDGGLQLSVLDAAAADRASADALWRALAEAAAGRPLRLVDEPEDSVVALAARDAGLQPVLAQVEMHAGPLPRSR